MGTDSSLKQKSALLQLGNQPDKESRAREWFESTCARVAQAMKFGILKLTYEYTEEDEPDFRWSDGDGAHLLSINVLTPYKTACIEVTPMAMEQIMSGPAGKEMVLHAIVHELCHVHTAPLADAARHRFLTEHELDTRVEEVTESFADYVRENLKLTHKELYDL